MEFNGIKTLILNILIENEIEPKQEIFDKLEIYYDMLVEYNKNVNLTAITEKNQVYIKHFADSLLGIKNYEKNSTLCDIGTGAGFPGLVIKIARPDLKVTLVDSLNKRITFINQVISALNITNISALHSRAEDKNFINKYLNTFDYVIARAVAPMNTLTEYCLPFVKVGGQFIAYKSQNADDECRVAQNCIKIMGGSIKKIAHYNLIDEYERNLIIVDKISKTSNLYPRDKNKPRTQPLK